VNSKAVSSALEAAIQNIREQAEYIPNPRVPKHSASVLIALADDQTLFKTQYFNRFHHVLSH
jgi:hypothetical protein